MDWAIGVDPAPHVQWLREYYATVAPFTHGFYTNDVMDESQRVVNRNYANNYERLVELKNKYDPTNLFRLNANVVPTA
jgi:FAD/FMN-containing dehydrogenase